VTVKASGKGIHVRMDDAVTIEGTLHVGPILEGGFIVGLYQMEGAAMIESEH
jgi:hypothetical protein